MNSWFGKLMLAMLGIMFLLRGGIGIILALWRILLPLALLGGGWYLLKQFLADQKKLKQGERNQNPTSVPSNAASTMITICPHCMQELGSCPKCKSLGS